MKQCPKCGYKQLRTENKDESCQRCGLIFAKYKERQPPAIVETQPMKEERPPIKPSKVGPNQNVNPNNIIIILVLIGLVFGGHVSIDYFERRSLRQSGFSTIEQQKKAKAQGYSTKAEQDRAVSEKNRKEAEERSKKNAAAAIEKQKKDAECRLKLECFGEKKRSIAEVFCDDEIEKLAKYSFEWTDGWLESKFTHYRWLNQEAGIISYSGSKIKFQNGFGAYQYHIYECAVDAINEKVLSVSARPGRL